MSKIFKANEEFLSGNTITAPMDFIRELCSVVSSVRSRNSLPNSYPLPYLTIYQGDDLFDLIEYVAFPRSNKSDLTKVLEQACDVDEVEYEYALQDYYDQFGLDNQVSLEFRELGPILGSSMKDVTSAIKSRKYTIEDGDLVTDHGVVRSGFWSRKVRKTKKTPPNVEIIGNDSFMVLDISRGFGKSLYNARRMSRELNTFRKDNGYFISDTPNFLVLSSDREKYESFLKHADFIRNQANLSGFDARFVDDMDEEFRIIELDG